MACPSTCRICYPEYGDWTYGLSTNSVLTAFTPEIKRKDTVTSFKDIQKGDEVSFTVTGKVSDTWKSSVGGNVIDVDPDSGNSPYGFSVKEGTGTVKVTKKAKPKEPDCWPPQSGDVWRSGKDEYVAIASYLYRTTGTLNSQNMSSSGRDEFLRKNPDVKLVHRTEKAA